MAAPSSTHYIVLDTRCFDVQHAESHKAALATIAQSILHFLHLRLCFSGPETIRTVIIALNSRMDVLFSSPLAQGHLSQLGSTLENLQPYYMRSIDRTSDSSTELFAAAIAPLLARKTDTSADNARLLLLITNPEAFPWRTERLRKVLRGLNNAMVPVDVILFSPPVISLFGSESPVENSWEKLKELGEIGRTWLNCKVTKTPNSTPPALAVLRLSHAGEALYESLKRIAVEPPRFALALQIGSIVVQCTALAETTEALHSRVESVCLCHGTPVKITPMYTCAENHMKVNKVKNVESIGRMIVGNVKPASVAPQLRAEELFAVASLNNSAMRGESVLVLPSQDFDNIAEYDRNKALFDALLLQLRDTESAVHLTCLATFPPARSSTLGHHFVLIPPATDAPNSAFLLQELVPAEAFVSAELPVVEPSPAGITAAVQNELKGFSRQNFNPLALRSGLHELAVASHTVPHTPPRKRASSPIRVTPNRVSPKARFSSPTSAAGAGEKRRALQLKKASEKDKEDGDP